MSQELAQRWKRLFQRNCGHWNDSDKRRYWNVVNDPDDVDEIELQSALEMIEEINGKPAVDDPPPKK